MDVELLARIQFAFTVAFHYIYPPLSIGIGLLMVVFESLYVRTKKEDYHILAKFWTKIFALTFGIGVVTGIVMEFEFGTNWATYSRYVGDVFGSALAAEGIFAFALESGFLGVLLFGWNRVKPWVHLVSTIGVFLGSMFSAIWIVVANSWQQTPAGYHIVGEGMQARAEITDFWAMVFNPSSVERIWHVWLGAFLAGVFLILSVHAYYILRGRYVSISKKAFKITLIIATITSLAQLVAGHASAEVVAEHQPAKLAALEGHYDESAAADMYLFGWVDQEKQEVTGLAIPGGLSFLLDQDFEAPVTGLNAFPADERPSQVNAVFQFYHLMVAIGMFLIALTLYASFLLWKKKLFTKKWLLWVFVFTALLPQIANQVGWFSAEMGRQPWVVYGLLRTNEAFSQAVTANQVLFSLILFFAVYALLFLLFVYLLNKKIKHGPYEEANDEDDDRPLTKEISEVVTG
ncbi:cytochrome ubiquinol oxidase subunit I [Leeuwenhoekiella palythoae]|uniref:Cytochrome bd-I ubiquinol oxidase subunit 1 apoprotein n=1 Tax=Leeuwenhoekiella palythoae TaxID=573501 RepID=A0A1M5XHB4_9FLAO|nr:cytochrome ubiquinol oxidase subunit I [Leeuwenhoekiella palythoae]RXG30032.1 cytochrome bd-I ubiquinol oxidase subunit 1 apoprotein [Leeuwenhoekiella palythoae]SHH98904.1 cytochrome bd-I ubiquinol oxidase subunit 1 apoprotein [Leeuwenhoekiella palythoae]